MSNLKKSPIKIVHVTTDLAAHGAQMVLYRLLSRLNRDCYDSVVISLMDGGELVEEIQSLGVPVYTIGLKNSIPTPGQTYFLIKTLSQLKADLIQGWMYHGNLAAQVSNFFVSQNIPVLLSIHHCLYSLEYEKKMTRYVIQLSAFLSRLATGIIFVSNVSKRQHEQLGYFSPNTIVIPNGIDTGQFVPSQKARSAIRAELGLSNNSLLIGLIARFHPMKDHKTFLKAAALLIEEVPDLDIHFVLAGKGINWENTFLSKSVTQLGLTTRMHLLGERNDIPSLTASLDIASLSSYSETFSNVTAEAMSCGIPCVATDVGDLAYVINQTGYLVPPREPLALANAWKQVIDLGQEGRVALGKLARSRIINNFSLDNFVVQYENFYKTIPTRK
ncbi:glycosyltransferase family 4 protein [Laspinema palackyanum]|uniref:glycosyltransferase family 4 protein n=1 Tax=Laspinema palackyanum TaxID=3231601 RepID=UPI00345D8783|nr:glycosyltransferase [Laspinema sp. D2c]